MTYLVVVSEISFLPITDTGMDAFAQYWTTDTGLDFENVARLYNLKYYKTADLDKLKVSIKESFNKKGIKIIEAKTQIPNNVKSHQNFMEKVAKVLTLSS